QKQRWPPRLAKECIFFPKGSCRNGDKCRFVHSRPETPGPSQEPGLDQGVEGPRLKVPCPLYSKGFCAYGKRCRFLHPVVEEEREHCNRKSNVSRILDTIYIPGD